jgi:hypothetical protein
MSLHTELKAIKMRALKGSRVDRYGASTSFLLPLFKLPDSLLDKARNLGILVAEAEKEDMIRGQDEFDS